ncbi:MAG: transketolase [Nitrospinae bacterium]|nr:transketolase [Nitrospinota bacterium]
MKEIKELERIAVQIRIDILKMLTEAGSGHTGGSLSTADILTALFFSKMRHDPNNPKWEERDIFVLSKGHAVPALYAVLGRCGYFSIDNFLRLRKLGSILQGHPMRGVTPGIDVSTGSLGQGLSQANGIALASKINNKKRRIYVMLGDGEVQEGQIWESAMTASHYKIDNLCAILDNNGLQIDGRVSDIMSIDPLPDKWKAFGWNVIEIDGHKFEEILSSLNEAEKVIGKPTIIIAHTIKGKGVSFMEGKVEYHGIPPTWDELEKGLKELKSI